MGLIKIKSELKNQPEQATLLTLALREALSVLAMPLADLAQWLQTQIEQNPALQFKEDGDTGQEDSPTRSCLPWHASISGQWIDQIAAPEPTLSSYLLQQAREALSTSPALKEMEELIGNLDSKGFIEEEGVDSKLLTLLQSFDPPGVGAKNLQHSLLLQLERRGEKETLAYRLIQHHYSDFLQGCKNLPYTLREMQSAIQTLSQLTLDPAAPFRFSTAALQIPDLFVESSDHCWTITLNETLLPKFTIHATPELSSFESSARWIEKMISRRGTILTSVVKIVLQIQNDFFRGVTSDLHPLSFKVVAQKLSLHPSTISRAVKDKIVSCPRGIYPLHFFFPHASSGSVSHHTAKERLKTLIEQEKKESPFSDQELVHALREHGILCARRTVTKYRQSLKIPPASRRRKNFI